MSYELKPDILRILWEEFCQLICAALSNGSRYSYQALTRKIADLDL
jgi:hypothetical protein